MPRPEVDVAQAQPQVEVNQPPPRVEIVAPEQEAEVQVEQAQTEVQVAGAEAQVQITEAEQPVVRYEREETQVVINEPEGEPSIRFEQMEAAEGDPEMAAADQQQADQQMAAADQARAQTELEEVSVTDLQGLTVYLDDEEIGIIDQVLIRAEDDQGYAIIDHQGHETFGEKMIAYPVAYLHKDGDRLILAGMNSEQLAAIPEWVPDDQQFRQVENNETVMVTVLAE
jgi:hypothetical protein